MQKMVSIFGRKRMALIIQTLFPGWMVSQTWITVIWIALKRSTAISLKNARKVEDFLNAAYLGIWLHGAYTHVNTMYYKFRKMLKHLIFQSTTWQVWNDKIRVKKMGKDKRWTNIRRKEMWERLESRQLLHLSHDSYLCKEGLIANSANSANSSFY